MRLTSKFSLVAIPLAILSLSATHAQTTVATDPVGYVTLSIPSGVSILSVPLIEGVVFSGQVDQVSGNIIQVSGSLPDIEGPHYVRIESGNSQGSTSSIIAYSPTSLTLEDEIGVNQGDQFAVIPHHTLDSLFGSELADLTSLTVYGGGVSETYTYFSGFGWFDDSNQESGNAVVFPGEGIVVNTQQASALIQSGEVFSRGLSVPITASSVNVIASRNPVASVAISDLVTGLSDLDSVTIYDSSSGSLQTVETLTFFEGFGFFDSANNSADDFQISPLIGFVVRSGTSKNVTLEGF